MRTNRLPTYASQYTAHKKSWTISPLSVVSLLPAALFIAATTLG